MSTLNKLIVHFQEALGISHLPKTERVGCDVTKRQLVLESIGKRSKAITTDDLPSVVEELMSYFEENKNSDYFNDYFSNDYFRLLDLQDKPDARVVVIGDIHCDYYALAAIMLKLTVSDYDYFENAYFVFMGDYLDRGGAVFEPLLLMMDLKRILGNRMIMLRGNHELIDYKEEKQELESLVIPQDTCPILNEYCGENKEFLKTFGYFYKTLPTYVYLKVEGQNVLLTHAAVPRQKFLDLFYYDQATGAIEFEPEFLYGQNKLAQQKTSDDSLLSMTILLNESLLKTRNQILYDMIWGDPSHDKEKYQVSGRYQFGSKQFEGYAQKNKISRVFRSHEPERNGYEAFFDDRLFTIFSTGGSMNDQAGYGDINPAFAVVKGDGNCFIENSFIYKMEMGGIIPIVCNPFSDELLNRKAACLCSINEEFLCDEESVLEIEEIFTKIKEGFVVDEETEEEMKDDEIVTPSEASEYVKGTETEQDSEQSM